MAEPKNAPVLSGLRRMISSVYVPYGSDGTHTAEPALGRPVMLGMVALVFGLGSFMTWASLAPLASAAIAPGTVVVESDRKTIQHHNGGIIQSINVREGDQVTEGQVLMHLDEADISSKVELLEAQYLALLAKEARLLAERGGKDKMTMPPALLALSQRPDYQDVVGGQQNILESGAQYLAGRIGILNQRIRQYEKSIASTTEQVVLAEEDLARAKIELKNVTDLFEKGYERKPRVVAMQRDVSALKTRLSELRAQISTAHQGIAEARLQIDDARNVNMNDVAENLRATQIQTAEVKERLANMRLQLTRLDILAPVAGVVLNLRYVTPGGVVSPGQAILDIVPENEVLLIDARVDPIDIDVVHQGMPAEVRLTVFQQRTTPTLKGTVKRVSADALIDRATGISYYTARIEIDAGELKNLQGGAKLYPGMPVEVIIVSGERTVLEYLLDPIVGSFSRAFREQ